jgi:hypothetical protein
LNYVKLVEKKNNSQKMSQKTRKRNVQPSNGLVGGCVGKFIAEMGERRGVGAM